MIKLLIIVILTGAVISCSKSEDKKDGGDSGPGDFAFSPPPVVGSKLVGSEISEMNSVLQTIEVDTPADFLLSDSAKSASSSPTTSDPYRKPNFRDKSAEYKAWIQSMNSKCQFKNDENNSPELTFEVGSSQTKSKTQSIQGQGCPISENRKLDTSITILNVVKEANKIKSIVASGNILSTGGITYSAAESQKVTALSMQSRRIEGNFKTSADESSMSNSFAGSGSLEAQTATGQALQLNINFRAHTSATAGANNAWVDSSKSEYSGTFKLGARNLNFTIQKSFVGGRMEFKKLYVNGHDETNSGFLLEKLLSESAEISTQQL